MTSITDPRDPEFQDDPGKMGTDLNKCGEADWFDEDDPEPSTFERAGPGHRVMDRQDIKKALAISGVDDEDGLGSLSSGEEQRARLLIQWRDSNLWKPHVIGTPAMRARLDALEREQPNLAPYLQLVTRAAHVSMVSGTPLRVHPSILVGPPGTGKSRIVRGLADALGTSCELINGATLPDVGSLAGYPPVWRGSGPGRIAKALIAATTTSPIVCVDEATRINDAEASAFPLDKLLSLLESTTASTYCDECLQVPMRAQHAIVVLACNDLNGLSDALLDRVICVEVKELDADQRDAVLETMLAEVAATLALGITFANRAALDPLRDLGLRRSRLAMEIAIGHAVADQRRFLTRGDLAAAVTLLQRPDEPVRAGFIHHRD